MVDFDKHLFAELNFLDDFSTPPRTSVELSLPLRSPKESKVSASDHHDCSVKSLFAGAVGGTFEVLTDNPIDLVKVRMQTATHVANSVRQPKHFLPILSQVIQQEGIAGLFQGATIRVFSNMPATAVSFWGYDWGQQLVRHLWHNNNNNKDKDKTNPTETLTIQELAVAGAWSGIPVTLFETPLERIKCLLQIQARCPVRSYNGPVDCGLQLFQREGLCGLYRGIGITAARNIPGFSVWFGTYEFLKDKMDRNKVFGSLGSAHWMNVIVSGGMAGSASWSVMIPFDAIKSVIQTSPQQLSIIDAYRQLTAKTNLALFRGIGPTVMIAFPANAMCFLGAELAWEALSMFDS